MKHFRTQHLYYWKRSWHLTACPISSNNILETDVWNIWIFRGLDGIRHKRKKTSSSIMFLLVTGSSCYLKDHDVTSEKERILRLGWHLKNVFYDFLSDKLRYSEKLWCLRKNISWGRGNCRTILHISLIVEIVIYNLACVISYNFSLFKFPFQFQQINWPYSYDKALQF